MNNENFDLELNNDVENFNLTPNDEDEEFTVEFGEIFNDGGTHDYDELYNKPQVNGVTLEGNKTLSELGIPVYRAGNNITISGDNTISAVDTKYTAGNGLKLSGTTFSADTGVLATKTELSSKQDKINDLPAIREGATAGATAVQPGDLATVATTGSYNDSLNKPSINNVTLTGNKTLDALGIQPKGDYALESEIPDVSNFITNTVDNLVNYYKKSETFTKQEVNDLISAITTMDIRVVQTLPTEDISTTTIYLVPKQTAGTNDAYDEYIYVSNAWEHIGSTEVDLTNYVKKTNNSAQQTIQLTSGTGTTPLGIKSMAQSSYISFAGTGGWLGSYGVNSNKLPIFYNGSSYTLAYTTDIPTKTSDLTNDSNYVKTTDYANSSTAGVIKTSSTYGTDISQTGVFYGSERTYQQYQDGGANLLIAKGTLENVITGKGLGTYSKPSGGIPATDLTTSVQTTLTKADNQVWYGTQAQYDDLATINPDTLYCIVG